MGAASCGTCCQGPRLRVELVDSTIETPFVTKESREPEELVDSTIETAFVTKRDASQRRRSRRERRGPEEWREPEAWTADHAAALDCIHAHSLDNEPIEEIPPPDAFDKEAAEILKSGKGLKLISALWLLRQGEGYVIQRFQDLPPEAFLPSALAAHYMLSGGPAIGLPLILALTYRWLTPSHPDPQGHNLAEVQAFLMEILTTVYVSVTPHRVQDIGIFWDFMCLPQKDPRNPSCGRTPAEEGVFGYGLKAINKLYGSRFRTMVLQLLFNWDGQHPYSQSGWCCFEESVASMQKNQFLLVALGSQEPQTFSYGMANEARTVASIEPPEDISKCPWRQRLLALGLKDLHKKTKFRDYAYDKYQDVQSEDFKAYCASKLRARKPPMHPDDMERLLKSDDVKFTNGADIAMVSGKYEEMFNQVAQSMTAYTIEPLLVQAATMRRDRHTPAEYRKIEWPLYYFELLVKALVGTETMPGFKNCTTISLSGLESLSREAAELLAAQLIKMPSLNVVNLCQGDDEGLRNLRESLASKGIAVKDPDSDP